MRKRLFDDGFNEDEADDEDGSDGAASISSDPSILSFLLCVPMGMVVHTEVLMQSTSFSSDCHLPPHDLTTLFHTYNNDV